ncbi:MAG: hypothetical protein ACI87W_003377, partial [Halieaceae bacterium]
MHTLGRVFELSARPVGFWVRVNATKFTFFAMHFH